MTNTHHPQIFCAIDTNDFDKAKALIEAVKDICGIKLGLEFFNAYGSQGVRDVMAHAPDTPLFLDLKYHDIPNTVAGAIRAVTHQVQPAYINVHASGGSAMMKAAKEACPSGTKLLAVTILTSLHAQDLEEVGYSNDISSQVKRLAMLAKESGLDGVVCSPHEIEMIKEACGHDFITMVPGIRPEGSAMNDQKRVMTPKEAITHGVDHMVIGRPITQATDPAEAAKAIMLSLS
jgi:orotidine-5'-phosphate decarboxylase